MRKHYIEEAAISGIPVHPLDATVVPRGVVAVRLRYAWGRDENEDARVWHGIMRAARRRAENLAVQLQRNIPIMNYWGDTLDVCYLADVLESS